jgi:hypothetical protein
MQLVQDLFQVADLKSVQSTDDGGGQGIADSLQDLDGVKLSLA